jgi:hypothetical protein
MITQQSQIKLNLSQPLKEFALSKAQKYGMPLASYIKHLIIKDIEGMEYPTFEASESTIKAYKKALRDKEKAIEVTDVKDFFKNL